MNFQQARTLLGVTAEATPEDIKKAYRRAANVHHPDKGGDAEKFKEVKEAYEFLSNPGASSTREYTYNPFSDMFGKGASKDSTFKFEDFEELEKKFRYYSERAQKSSDSFSNIKTAEVEISIKEAFNGNPAKRVALWKNGPEATVAIPPGLQHRQRVGEIKNGGHTYHIIASLKNDPEYDIDLGLTSVHSRGNIYHDLEMSALKMIVGGYYEFDCIDGGTVQVRVPAGLGAGKLLKIKERGHWRNSKREERGDCFLRCKPVINKLEDYGSEDLDELSRVLNAHTANKPA